MMQKVTASQGGATSNSEREHVIRIIERPSQLTMTSSPAQHQQTTPDIHPVRASPRRVSSVASPGPDVNQQLVERIEELYRQLHQTTPATPTAV